MKPKAGSFTTFLEARQKQERGQEKVSKVSAIGLLGILNAADKKELLIEELVEQSKMGFMDFAESLKTLQTNGLVAMAKDQRGEIVQITPKGEEVAGLSKSD